MQKAGEPENDAGFPKHNYSQLRPMKVDSLIPVSFLAGINAGGRSLFIIHYHDLKHQFSVYFNLITVKIKK